MSEADVFAAEMKAASGKMRQRLSQLSSASYSDFLQRVKARTPVESGDLKDSFRIEGGQDLSDGALLNDQDYASFVEEGTPTKDPVGMVMLTVVEMNAETIDDGEVIE